MLNIVDRRLSELILQQMKDNVFENIVLDCYVYNNVKLIDSPFLNIVSDIEYNQVSLCKYFKLEVTYMLDYVYQGNGFDKGMYTFILPSLEGFCYYEGYELSPGFFKVLNNYKEIHSSILMSVLPEYREVRNEFYNDYLYF